MAKNKRMIHYQSAEYYRIKFLRSIITALLIILISMFPLVAMQKFKGTSWTLTIVIGVILVGFFLIQIRTNYKLWQDQKAEEEAKTKHVHKRAPAKKQ